MKRDDLTSNAYLGLGVLLLNSGERDKAIKIWRKARQLAEKSHDPVLIASSEFFDNLFFRTSGEKSKTSIGKLNDRFFRLFGQDGEAGILMLRATTMLKNGEFLEADAELHKALIILQEIGERQGQALAYYNLGISANGLGRLDDAFLYFHKSLNIAEELGDQTGLTNLYSALGLLHLQKNEFSAARVFLEKAVDNLRRDGDRELLSEKLFWYGYALANSGDLEKALIIFTECQSLSRELGTLDELNPVEEIRRIKHLLNPTNAPSGE